MKKKLFSLALALALCLGLAVPAFAAGGTVSVTDAGISFDAISTDRYDDMKSSTEKWNQEHHRNDPVEPEDEFQYAVGYINNSEGGFSGFWTYLVNEDVKLDFHLKKGEKFSIDAYYLTESGKSSDGVTTYTPISIANYWISANEDGELVGKELIEEFFPGANYLVCWRGTADEFDPDNAINIVFADKNGAPSTVPAFSDVAPTAFYAAPVAWAVHKGITNGYGSNDKFAPSIDCTEAQILTFLYRAAGKPSTTKSPVSVAVSYQDAINWAYEKGMIDGDFKENTPCTRATAVNYIWQAFDKPKAEKASSFTDVDKGTDYAEAVSWAVEKGVTNGYGGNETFAPDRVCNRGEIVTFLYRAYKK